MIECPPLFSVQIHLQLLKTFKTNQINSLQADNTVCTEVFWQKSPSLLRRLPGCVESPQRAGEWKAELDLPVQVVPS